MPHAYYEILVRLSETEGHNMRMSELAVQTRSSRSRLSHAIDRLQERGWVERADCPTDRRGQLAHLTEKGFAVLSCRGAESRSHGPPARHRPAQPRTDRPAGRDRQRDRRRSGVQTARHLTAASNTRQVLASTMPLWGKRCAR